MSVVKMNSRLSQLVLSDEIKNFILFYLVMFNNLPEQSQYIQLQTENGGLINYNPMQYQELVFWTYISVTISNSDVLLSQHQ
jgi:hypothetical protein